MELKYYIIIRLLIIFFIIMTQERIPRQNIFEKPEDKSLKTVFIANVHCCPDLFLFIFSFYIENIRAHICLDHIIQSIQSFTQSTKKYLQRR